MSSPTSPTPIPLSTNVPDTSDSSEDPALDVAPEVTEHRRSTRVRNVPSHLRDYQCYNIFFSTHTPSSYKEASTDPLWQQAMNEELQALDWAQTWDIVPLPPNKAIISSKWVFKVKTKSYGSVDR